ARTPRRRRRDPHRGGGAPPAPPDALTLPRTHPDAPRPIREKAVVGGEMREERRVVTAMFADLVGSTALAERLGPEDAKLIVNDAVARVIGAVEAFGGTVKDLAGEGGAPRVVRPAPPAEEH